MATIERRRTVIVVSCLLRQPVAAFVLIAHESAGAPQVFQLQHDLAAVLAADRGHQLLEEFRAVAQRVLDRREAGAFEVRRLGNLRFELLLGADRHRQIEAGLRPQAAMARERASEPKAAAIAFRASPGTRWRMAMRTL